MDNEEFSGIMDEPMARIEETERSGAKPDEETVRTRLQEIAVRAREAPGPDFNGFSPDEMGLLLHSPFSDTCPVRIRAMSDDDIGRMPLIRQMLLLMGMLEKKELRLTASGYLPTKTVAMLSSAGICPETGGRALRETDAYDVRVARTVLEDRRLIKVRLGKISLTAKGKKGLHDRNVLLREALQFLMSEFNVAWLKWCRDPRVGNTGRLYSLWLLHRFGSEWRPADFYVCEYGRAFPMLDASSGYFGRVFGLLFRMLGLCELRVSDELTKEGHKASVRKTALLEKVFSFTDPSGEMQDP